MRNSLLLLAIILSAHLATPFSASASWICGDMSIDCYCKCENGMELNWEDEFKISSSCSGFLCSGGCRTDISKAADRCFQEHNKTCFNLCQQSNSKLDKLCAQQDGGEWVKGDSCYSF